MNADRQKQGQGVSLQVTAPLQGDEVMQMNWLLTLGHTEPEAQALVMRSLTALIVIAAGGVLVASGSLTWNSPNRSPFTWLRRLVLTGALSFWGLLFVLWGMRGNYHTYVWLISQECPVCTGSGPALMVIFVGSNLMALAGLVLYGLLTGIQHRIGRGSSRR